MEKNTDAQVWLQIETYIWNVYIRKKRFKKLNNLYMYMYLNDILINFIVWELYKFYLGIYSIKDKVITKTKIWRVYCYVY